MGQHLGQYEREDRLKPPPPLLMLLLLLLLLTVLVMSLLLLLLLEQVITQFIESDLKGCKELVAKQEARRRFWGQVTAACGAVVALAAWFKYQEVSSGRQQARQRAAFEEAARRLPPPTAPSYESVHMARRKL